MLMRIIESPQNVNVAKFKKITVQQITNYLILARRSKEYVKFFIGNYYIMVVFNRDGSINLTSNIRTERKFQKELFKLDQRGYRQAEWAYFIAYWLNTFKSKNSQIKYNSL